MSIEKFAIGNNSINLPPFASLIDSTDRHDDFRVASLQNASERGLERF